MSSYRDVGSLFYVERISLYFKLQFMLLKMVKILCSMVNLIPENAYLFSELLFLLLVNLNSGVSNA